MMNNPHAVQLLEKINKRDAVIGIIGLGYVGLPLALAFTEKGFRVIGFDTDPVKVDKLNRGECYIKHLDPTRLTRAVSLVTPDVQSEGSGSEKSEIRNPKSEIKNGCDGKFEIRNSKSEIEKGQADRELRIENSKLKIEASASPRLEATTDFSRLSDADAVLICVPTPLGPHKEPDLQYVEASAESIREALRPGQLIILESTTYPGTTDDLLKPILEGGGEPRMAAETAAPQTAPAPRLPNEKSEINDQTSNRGHIETSNEHAGRAEKSEIRNSKFEINGAMENSEFRIPNSELENGCDGKSEIRNPKSEINDGCDGKSEIRNSKSEILKCGQHFFLAFSPEREDPGNPNFGTTNVPKVVGGVDPISGDLAQALYDQIIDCTVRVASARIAEAAKLTENIFRSVNIALVNELKIIYDRLGIDIWDVLDAAATKPFGFMRFNPGPGLGGHCIIGSEWLRIRGCGLSGIYRAEDLFKDISRRFPAAVTRNGIFVEPDGLEALALDAESGDVAWFPVTTLYRGKYHGAGVCLSTIHGRQLTVTDEHPMLVRRSGSFDTMPAINLKSGDCLPVVTDDASEGPALNVSGVTAIDHAAIDGWVYSMEVEGAGAFTTSSGICVHNCIPLDPFYLAWRAREAGVPTRFIELAGEINTSMPGYVIDKLQAALNDAGKAVNGAKVLILGLAYKPDIDDPRESPAFEIIDRLLKLSAEVIYHDPHIPVAPQMRSWPDLPSLESTELKAETLESVDAVILVTDHRAVDYDLVVEHASLIIDTRGALRQFNPKVHRA